MEWIYVLIGVVVILLIFIAGNYNSLVSLRNKVKDQWAQIDVQLKRRFDLIPNLVETVKGYTKHEKETFEDVVKASNSFNAAKTPEDEMKANCELCGAITKLFALSESYPHN
jgi:LemA protein